MTAAERGYLLLCCDLADSDAKPLTLPQLRHLRQRMQTAKMPGHPERDLTAEDMIVLGYDRGSAQRIADLLEREEKLDQYLRLARQHQVDVITCISPHYPQQLLDRLGNDAPAVLFCRGQLSLLGQPCLALVGSRQIAPANKAFAQHIGTLTAQEDYVLVSGNAVGADQAAQTACLAAGGSVISFLPDNLLQHQPAKGQLLVSANSFHAPFSIPRALQRNTLIHAMAEKVFVAQCDCGHGGTWAGATENLRRGLSEVYVYHDNSPASQALQAQGATPVPAEVGDLHTLKPTQMRMF